MSVAVPGAIVQPAVAQEPETEGDISGDVEVAIGDVVGVGGPLDVAGRDQRVEDEGGVRVAVLDPLVAGDVQEHRGLVEVSGLRCGRGL